MGRAIEDGKVKVSFYNPKDYLDDPKKRVDEKPYGGGPGMVIRPRPVIKAIEHAKRRKKNVKILFLTPGGEQFTNEHAGHWQEQYDHLILVAGRYEGIDERARQAFNAEEVSIGPYVLTGGELPAMIIMDAVSRHVPYVLGDETSREEERAASHDVYTRPESFTYKRERYDVPDVLLSGDHKKIEQWRKGKRDL